MITKTEFNKWYELRQQVINGWHLSSGDNKELIRLNYLVMEACHEIHNNNMLEGKK